jgi:hypothetical protein
VTYNNLTKEKKMKKFYYAESIEGYLPAVRGPFDTLEEAKKAYDLPAAALRAYEDEGDIEGTGAQFFSINLENGVKEDEEEYYFEARDPDINSDSYAAIGFVPPADGE